MTDFLKIVSMFSSTLALVMGILTLLYPLFLGWLNVPVKFAEMLVLLTFVRVNFQVLKDPRFFERYLAVFSLLILVLSFDFYTFIVLMAFVFPNFLSVLLVSRKALLKPKTKRSTSALIIMFSSLFLLLVAYLIASFLSIGLYITKGGDDIFGKTSLNTYSLFVFSGLMYISSCYLLTTYVFFRSLDSVGGRESFDSKYEYKGVPKLAFPVIIAIFLTIVSRIVLFLSNLELYLEDSSRFFNSLKWGVASFDILIVVSLIYVVFRITNRETRSTKASYIGQ